MGFGVPSEEMAGQLEHVIGVAGFLAEVGELGGEDVGRRAEMFVDAVAASDVAAVKGDLLPEKERGVAIVCIASELELARRADEFGDLRVGMEASEGVAAL